MGLYIYLFVLYIINIYFDLVFLNYYTFHVLFWLDFNSFRNYDLWNRGLYLKSFTPNSIVEHAFACCSIRQWNVLPHAFKCMTMAILSKIYLWIGSCWFVDYYFGAIQMRYDLCESCIIVNRTWGGKLFYIMSCSL